MVDGGTLRRLAILAVSAGIASLAASRAVEAHEVVSASMAPSLLVGDWVLVDRLAFRGVLPFHDSRRVAPKHGDVVVFEISDRGNGAPLERGPALLVKRVVGLPRDTIYMRDGALFVNGVAERADERVVRPPGSDNASQSFQWQRGRTLVESRFGEAPEEPTVDRWGPLVVPEDSLFMLGDNRHHSRDSRYFGFVPVASVRGKPMVVYLSTAATPKGRSLAGLRWSRIGVRVR